MIYCPNCQRGNSWPSGRPVGLDTCEVCTGVHTACMARPYSTLPHAADTKDTVRLPGLLPLVQAVDAMVTCMQADGRQYNEHKLCINQVRQAHSEYRRLNPK